MEKQQERIVYSVPVQDTKTQGFTPIYRDPEHVKQLLEYQDPQIRTLKDVVNVSCLKKYPKNPFLAKIKIHKQTDGSEKRSLTQERTYKECFEEAQKIGSAINALKLFSESDDTTLTEGVPMKFIGIFSKNRPEWTLVDMACILYGLTSVPLYDTLGTENLSYCLKQTGISTLFCTSETAQTLAKLKQCGNLKNVILMDTPQKEVQSNLQSRFKIYTYKEVIQAGAKHYKPSSEFVVKPTDCNTFSYTSGTTGPPKGVMLSHKNFISLLSSFNAKNQFSFKDTDRHVSFLPLPHVYQRDVVYALLMRGASITFFGGNIAKLKDDCQFVKPTIFPGVPRLFNRIYDSVQKVFQDAPEQKRSIIKQAVDTKIKRLRETGQVTHPDYDKQIFATTRQSFGGEISKMITGSAPLKKEVHEFIKIIMCSPVIEVYGQTQNCGGAFNPKQYDSQLGHVGGIFPGLEFKLADIPEMNKFSTDKNEQGESAPRGQVWLRGPMIFMGYYKNPEKTKQALSDQGWLRTGDVGMLLPGSNALKLIDRKKNIFKLSQGEYVASQKVEACYLHSDLVAQIFLHGDSVQSFVVAIISPEKDKIIQLGNSINVKSPSDNIQSLQEFYDNKDVRTAICKQLNDFGKQEGLKGFQQVKNIYLDTKTFQERDILTNTLKLQRFNARQCYKDVIQKMYTEGSLL